MENQTHEIRKRATVTSPEVVRQAIGYLGITMPAILLIGTFVIGRCPEMQDSISHYYYTIMGDVLVITLCAFAVFLFMYQGYERHDNIATSIAAFFALGVALFPTSPIGDISCSVVCLDDISARVAVHYISAALFFLTLSYISIFLFTKSAGQKTPEKILRNKIYVACGVLILFFLVMIFILKVFPNIFHRVEWLRPVFWLEWFALIAFGVSWLVKGKAVLGDRK